MRLLFIMCLFGLPMSIFAQAPPETIVTGRPENGEGILHFLERHKINTKDHLQEFMDLNTGKFGKDGGLLVHQSYVLPTVTTTLKESLFGEDFESITITDRTLANATLLLVSGHGGPDPGAIGHYGTKDLYEDEYAYDITLRLARNLMERGATVKVVIQDPNDGIRTASLLTPNKEETCLGQPIPLNQMDRLRQRAEAVNTLAKDNPNNYQRCLVIHLDSRSKRNQLDVFFYHHEKSKTGLNMANTMRGVFEQNYKRHQPKRGFSGTVTDRNLFMLRKTTPATVFIELGNIRNFRDQQRFILENNRQALANWLCEGIIKDYQNHLNKLN